MPGLYAKGDYDLAGFAVGAAERGTLLPKDVGVGDVLIGLPSSGVHSNGFSLVRRIVEHSGLAWDAPAPFAQGRSLAEALLEPTRIYVKPLLEVLKGGDGINALCHITGGGFPDNIPRVLPDGVGVRLDLSAIAAPPVFGWLAQDRRRGGGRDAAHLQLRHRHDRGGKRRQGRRRDGAPGESGRETGAHRRDDFACGRRACADGRLPEALMTRRRVAILISGRGSNMVSLIEAASRPDFPAEIALVLSNRPDAAGLEHARAAGIATLAIDHKAFPDRETFDRAMDAALKEHDIAFICLAGFMRVLTDGFVERWSGQMINIHPSLLPLYRGTRTHRRALDDGVLLHGCTVHFVVPELDAGPIIAQAAVPVVPGDTEESLAARVIVQEHILYPQALRTICDGTARLDNGRVVFSRDWDANGALHSPSGEPGQSEVERRPNPPPPCGEEWRWGCERHAGPVQRLHPHP